MKELKEDVNKENQRDGNVLSLPQASVFGDEKRKPRAKDCGQPFEAEKGKEGSLQEGMKLC